MIRKITLTAKLAGTLVIALSFSFSSFGQTIAHDLQEDKIGQFTVAGIDPFIIFSAKQQNENANYLVLDLGDDVLNKPLELFFVSKNDIFKPHYKISFVATRFPSALALPKSIDVSRSTRLRLDIDQCPACVINFENLPKLINDQVDIPIIEPTRIQNGINHLTPRPKLIPTNGWQLNDLDGDLSNFRVSGDDPYIVSPILTTSTHQLAGVYFSLKAPPSGEVWNNYQLFYQTERHSFTIQANSSLRNHDSLDGTIEFLIPLDFLSKELPSDTVLERLRLDLPTIPGQWSVVEASLVHEENLSEFTHLVPHQLIHTKQQRARGLSLIKKSLINVSSDLGFSISYLLLLVLTCFFFLRAYRSNA